MAKANSIQDAKPTDRAMVQYRLSVYRRRFYIFIATGVVTTKKKFKLIKITNRLKKQFVDAHNKARSTVVPTAADMVPVQWDKKIAKISKKFVKYERKSSYT